MDNIKEIKESLEILHEKITDDVSNAFCQNDDYGNQRLKKWRNDVDRLLGQSLPTLATSLKSKATTSRMVYVAGETDAGYFFEYVRNRILMEIASILKDIESDEFYVTDYKEVNNKSMSISAINLKNRKCFIVHGRDNSFKLEVARHLEQKGFEAVILHEQPSGGRTVIEKLIKYANECEFAIVLYTPDDEGGLVNSGVSNKRARQNVIFEHGLTIGLMGREKVFTLVSDDNIEKPNDISGVVYIPQNNWKYDLDKEIQELGYTF